MICIIWHRVYLYIVSIYIEKEGERDRAIHFILDTIYLFRVRFGVYPVHSWDMLRGITHTEKVIYLACYCLPSLQGTSAAVCTLPSKFFFHLLIEFFFFFFFVGSSFVFVIRLSDLLLSLLFSTFLPRSLFIVSLRCLAN